MIHIDGIIYSLQRSGGISIYFSEVIKRLILDRDMDCNIQIYKNSNHVLREYRQDHILPTNNTYIPLSLYRYIDVPLSERAEVFHSSYYRLPSRNFRRRVKVVTTVHDFTYERFSSGLVKYVHFTQKKRAILNSDIIVCISRNTKEDLISFIPEARDKDIRVVYNGVSDSFGPIGTKSEPKTKFVVYVGSRSGYKNFSSVVDALSCLPDFHLEIVGGGPLSKIEVAYLESKVRGRYLHHSFATNEKLNTIYNTAHCLVYPSLYEGFGIPAIEAMKSGCPVIASNTSSLPEVCSDAAILLDEVNGANIAEAISTLTNVTTRAQYVSKGLLNAKRFSWDHTYSSLKDIYVG